MHKITILKTQVCNNVLAVCFQWAYRLLHAHTRLHAHTIHVLATLLSVHCAVLQSDRNSLQETEAQAFPQHLCLAMNGQRASLH